MNTQKIDESAFVNQYVSNEYDLYLSEEIGSDVDYRSWFNILKNANQNDRVTIHINCYGGNVGTANQIVTFMKLCPAHIECRMEGMCFSAATMIFLAGDTFMVSESSNMMIHAYSIGYGSNKRHEVKIATKHQMKSLDKKFKKDYADFLTKKEINRMLKGVDLWLSPEEVIERLNKREEKRKNT